MTEQERLQRLAVVAEARTWLLTPYHHQARVKGVGVDCATILLEVFSAVGLAENAWPEYSPTWHLHRGEELYLEWMEKYTHEVESPDIGDIIVWKWGRCFSHGTIYIGGGQVIHSYLGIGCVLASIDEGIFQDRDRRFYSIWGKA